MQKFPRADYLKRIQLQHNPRADEAGLRALHQAQCLTIPFENLDPLLGKGADLDPIVVQKKLLHKNRGGYCFELNALFLSALQEFGFKARPKLARVYLGRPQAGPRTHQVNLVSIAGKVWLADVGFGGPGIVNPIPFESGYEEVQYGRKIRLRADPKRGMLYEEEEANTGWRLIYAIPDENLELVDLEVGNHYCATHPSSIFRQNLYCALPSQEGKISVWNRSVQIMRVGKKTEEKILQTEGDLSWLMSDLLKISLEEIDLKLILQKLPPFSPVAK